jgi:hypothetical protein
MTNGHRSNYVNKYVQLTVNTYIHLQKNISYIAETEEQN